MRRLLVGLVAGCVFGMCAAGASAQVIHACVKVGDGTLRIVETADDCKSNEYGLEWNIVGPMGLQGPPGVPGADGVDGADGADGKDGVQGPPGYSAPVYQFVGVTEAKYYPHNGIGPLHRACASDFEGSRMCRSIEILNTNPYPTLPIYGSDVTSSAWVQPVYVPFTAGWTSLGPEGRGNWGITVSGRLWFQKSGSASCRGWNPWTAEEEWGLIVEFNESTGHSGVFKPGLCDEERYVTCCAPAAYGK
jgi:hypothetical protein